MQNSIGQILKNMSIPKSHIILWHLEWNYVLPFQIPYQDLHIDGFKLSTMILLTLMTYSWYFLKSLISGETQKEILQEHGTSKLLMLIHKQFKNLLMTWIYWLLL